MSNFTPGPWNRQGSNEIAGKMLVCNVYEQPTEHIKLANANLIAAAPEMYEALTGIVEEMALADFDPTDEDTWYGRAIAILAKADGRAL